MNNLARTNVFVLYLVLAGAGLAILLGLLANDANYVLYRFAAHLATGRGLNYLTPDATISTYPLVPVLMAPFVNFSLPIAAWLASAIAIAVGAFFLDALTEKRLTAGLAYLLACLIYPSPVMLIMLALALAGLYAAQRQRWLLSGVLMGPAILAQPSALIPATLLIFLSLKSSGAIWRYLVPAALLPAFGLILVRFSLGDAVFVSVVPQLLTLALPGFALFALFRSGGTLRQSPIVALLFAWSAFSICIAFLRGTWPSAAIIPGTVALLTMLPMSYIAIAAAAIDLILNLVLPNPSAAVPGGQVLGEWIAAHTAPDATLATYDIGAPGYYSDRPLIDLSGRLQSNPFDKDFFLRSAPDLIVLNDNTQVAWGGFKTTYAKAFATDGQTVYQRVVNFTPLVTHSVNIDFSATPTRNDLHLTSVAVANTAHPGDLVRVRLDWQLNYASSFDKNIKVTLTDSAGKPPVTALDTIPAAAWTVGTNTTYHLLVLPKNLPAGHYSVNVTLTLNNGNLGPRQVAELDVTK